MTLPPSVDIVEVGPRDGLQLEPTFVPTATKMALVEAVARAGVRRIEVTSFVSPTAVPQMRDADEVLRGITRQTGVVYSALVPNRRGAERAIDAGADALRVVFSVTDAANRRNIGRSVEESLAELSAIAAMAARAGRALELILGMAFGCPLTGAVAPDRVVGLVGRGLDAGAREVFVADSYGFAHPLAVRDLVARLRDRWPASRIGLHLHDTRGLAVANAFAALQAGVHSLDASLGGIGVGGLGTGHPAAGNVATEDLVNLCEEIGVGTGIDVARMVEATHLVAPLLAHPVPGRIRAAGTRADLFARIAARGSGPDPRPGGGPS
jgi:hydroxymethylglutaryl-CoA lyase